MMLVYPQESVRYDHKSEISTVTEAAMDQFTYPHCDTHSAILGDLHYLPSLSSGHDTALSHCAGAD